jgi:hypothetical protein
LYAKKNSPPSPLHKRGELLNSSFSKSFSCGEGFRMRFIRKKTSPPTPLHKRGELINSSFSKSFSCGEGFRIRFVRR